MDDEHTAELPLTTSDQPPARGLVTSSNSSVNDPANKRRRGLGVVTPNACTECRKKRAKCDGQKPCGRCSTQSNVECVYEVQVRQSKESIRNEVEELRRQQRSSEHVLSAVVNPQLEEPVMTKLRGGQDAEAISEWLGRMLPSREGSSAHPGPPEPKSGADMLLEQSFYDVTGLASGGFESGDPHSTIGMLRHPIGEQQHDQSGDASQWHDKTKTTTTITSNMRQDMFQRGPDARLHTRRGWTKEESPASLVSQYWGANQKRSSSNSSKTKVPASTWTSVTQDSALVEHLLALYFCWEYPTFASLSKDHFLEDFTSGRRRYCCPILVNALLALGCRFSLKSNTRGNVDDPHTSGDHFFQESLKLLDKETDHYTLTIAQALGIMSIREASCGRDYESCYYAQQSIRIALEMGLLRMKEDCDEGEAAVHSATFWGAFALDHAWSMATGSLPQCSRYPLLPPKPIINSEIEATLWIPYTDDGAPLELSCEQPSNVFSIYQLFCELSELVHQSLYLLFSSDRLITSHDLLAVYTQYLDWHGQLPEALRLGQNFTPAVLFAHMYYHSAILHLFRPFIRLRIVGSSILPRDICSVAADAIRGLLRSYSQLYSLRRTPSFVPYFILTSTIIYLAEGALGPSATTLPLRGITKSSSGGANPPEAEASHVGLQGPPSNINIDTSSTSGKTKTRLSAKLAESIHSCTSDLAEMASCHQFANQILDILRYVAKKWQIEVDIPQAKDMTAEEANRRMRLLKNNIDVSTPNIVEDDFVCVWETHIPSVFGP